MTFDSMLRERYIGHIQVVKTIVTQLNMGHDNGQTTELGSHKWERLSPAWTVTEDTLETMALDEI